MFIKLFLVIALFFTLSASSGGKISEKIVCEMLLTPDGKNINAEALIQIVERLFQLNEAANGTYMKQDPFRSGEDENQTGPALDRYLSLGHQEPQNSEFPELNVVCDLCASVVDVFGIVSQLPKKEIWPTVLKAAKFLCPKIKGYPQEVCDGYVDTFEKLGCGTPDKQRVLWKVPIPDRLENLPAPISPPETNKEKLTVLYITDLHFDLEYQPGSVANCRAPLCCRNDSVPVESPVREDDMAGYWGDYRHCDLPVWTFDSMLRYINKTHSDEIDLIMIGGDYVAHDAWISNRETNKKLVEMMANKLSENLPGKPYFMALGNHDVTPLDNYAYPGDPAEFSTQWLYDKFTEVSLKWLNRSETEATLRRAGYYTTLLKPGWRLVVLNDNFCYDADYLAYGQPNLPDPYNILKWLVEILANAEKEGERVHILAHVWGGSDGCFQAWSWNYYRIIDRFSHVITGQFNGHAHQDFFVIYHDAETLTKPTAVAFIGPPSTPYKFNNAGYRLYDFDPKTYTLLNYRQFYGDIEAANEAKLKEVDWKFEYSALEEYSLPDMSPGSWAGLLKRMQTNSTLFDTFYRHYYLSVREPKEPCGVECHRLLLCISYESLAAPGKSWCERYFPNQAKPDDSDDPSKRVCSTRFLKRIDDDNDPPDSK